MIFDSPVRALAVGAMCALASACGGNYSNQTFEFENALPAKADFRAEFAVPQAPDAARSSLATLTSDAAARFNDGLDALLLLPHTALASGPPQLSTDEREWGPFAAPEASDIDARLVMHRVADGVFSLRVEERSAGSVDAWQLVQQGSLFAKGEGTLTLLASSARAAGAPVPNTVDIDTVSATYHRVSFPLTLELQVARTNNATPETLTVENFGFESESLTFETDWNAGGSVGVLPLSVHTDWLPTGEGISIATVLSGTQAGSTWTECWGTDFRTAYSSAPWNPPDVGARSNCPQIP